MCLLHQMPLVGALELNIQMRLDEHMQNQHHVFHEYENQHLSLSLYGFGLVVTIIGKALQGLAYSYSTDSWAIPHSCGEHMDILVRDRSS